MKKRFICMLVIVALALPLLAANASAAESTSANEKEMYNYLTAEIGLNSAAACGIMANAYYETGFRADITVGQYYGLFMYYGPLANALKTWCGSNNEDYSTVRGQMLYLKAMFNGLAGSWNYTSLFSSLRAVEDSAAGAYEAASMFCIRFEKPANAEAAAEKRGAYARDTLYAKYAGTTGSVSQFSSTSTSGSYSEIAVSYTAYVTASSLNIRKGPGMSYVTSGCLLRGKEVSIVAEAKDSSGKTWSKLSSGGWVYQYYLSTTAVEEKSTSTTQTSSGTQAFATASYTVTASALNVRTTAGTGNSISGCLKKGAVVTVVGETTDSSGKTWCQLQDGGWVCKTYLSSGNTASTSSTSSSSGTTYTVTASGLNVRKGAGTGFSVVRCLRRGTAVTVTATENDSSGDLWGQLSDGNWICMQYVK